MKAKFLAASLAAILLVVLLSCGSPKGANIQVKDVWARPARETGEMGSTSAVFMVLENDGGEDDRLVGAQTDVAEMVELHETVMEGEVMRMQHLPDGIELPAGEEVLLKPGGLHVMLIGLTQNLQVGDSFEVVLEFEKSGTMSIDVEVRQP
jgi:copper(I)-binding protein